MCNALHHAASCNCGFGGEWHLGGARGGERFQHRFGGSLVDVAKQRGTSIVVEVRCRSCQKAPVFLFATPSGGFTVFESLGLPWPKHNCKGRWSEEQFNELFQGTTIDGIALAAPKNKEDQLAWYYANNAETVDDWLKKCVQPVKNRKRWAVERNLERYRLKGNCLDSCPARLLQVLLQFCEAPEDASNIDWKSQIQMMRPIVKLTKKKARYYARQMLDQANLGLDGETAKIREQVLGLVIMEWLSHEGLPERVPTSSECSFDAFLDQF